MTDRILKLEDLDGTNGGLLHYSDYRFSIKPSFAGDFNGDGFDDVIVGSPGVPTDAKFYVGESYVVFGKASGFDAPTPISELDGTNGVVFEGIDERDGSGRSVSFAGDVNGDGIDDVIIGASREGYVVFGSTAGFAPTLPLSSIDGSNGFVIDGSSGSVSYAGDVNGDGIDDVIIGAAGGRESAGKSYVVFGSTAGFAPTLSLSSLNGSNGFVIEGIEEGDNSGGSVSSAGDVNGDGIDDLIIGARNADPGGRDGAGESYVVFGSTAGFAPTLSLSSLNGSNGFVIEGIEEGDSSGSSVSAAGDVNGDGFGDVIIGAPSANQDPRDSHVRDGESYVVFGRADDFSATFSLAGLNGQNGFELIGRKFNERGDRLDRSGHVVSSAGDLNGDGFSEVVVSGRMYDPVGSVEAYVVFGNSGGFDASLNFDDLDGSNGFIIATREIWDPITGAANAGDFNGDGLDDLVVIEPDSFNPPYGRVNAVFGTTEWSVINTIVGTEGDDVLSGTDSNDRIFGLGGADWITPNAGIDTIDGGDGFDQASFDTATGGIDASLADGRAVAGGETNTLINVEGVTGSSFSDRLRGDVGNNKLRGLGGADTFYTDAGEDTIEGGAGTDWLIAGEFSSGADDIRLSLLAGRGWTGAAENDQYSGIENVSSGWGNDHLTGDHGDNYLSGGYGNDTLEGNGGRDTLDGGHGVDVALFAYDRDKYLITQNGDQTIVDYIDRPGAFDGPNVVINTEIFRFADGDFDPFTLKGTPGDDWLAWDPADTAVRTVDGLAGFDMLSFGDANGGVSADLDDQTVFVSELGRSIDLVSIEAITGSSYADVLRGDDGNNKLRGLGGADTFYTDIGADTIEGGAGMDLLIAGGFYENAADIRLSLLAGRGWTGGANGDQYTGIENVSSGWGNDQLTGDHGDNHLSGGYGNDTLEGNGGRDTLDGGHGIDVALFAYDRDKYLITQNGDQTIVDYIDRPGDFDGPNVVINTEILRFADGDFDPFTLRGTPGDDWLAWNPADTTLRTVDGLAGFDMLSFGDANGGVSADLDDQMVFVSELGREIVLESIEGITGSSYADELRGDEGNNKLSGLGGPDVFYTDAGADTIQGGDGTDRLVAGEFAAGAADIHLSLLAGRGWSGDALADQYTGIENVSSGWGDDNLTGDHGDNHLNGGYGDDFLIGAGGDDTLDGGHGTDIVLFSGFRRDYTVTNDGFRTTVDYTGPGADDGTNIVIHSEILRFADGDLIL
ncbi:calcium-binding protein [Falsiruegeria mediterranea]|uniref:Bifunctional hemolysin/adenylate cyclase n=1 Tax=Falsiruegeria mediterranea M17 TaxID=1200281 RepID=A0A2R8C5A8_9RHOB|nr:FG-GAP repeat protein [Falsiruegeria mediterranea]SPJ27608.1 Bifunctional hemolysin/adenylate cyclase [Falsiruegeria mediterranea M17]